MTDRDLQRELLALLPRLDIELRHTGGDLEGGLVCLRGRRVLFLNPSLSESRQLDILCRILGREDLSRLFLLPAVRARLETGAGQPAGTFR
ncbi:MAG: hypothetical protein WAO20_08355 [Acidobacteriota bacterium]